MFPIEYIYGMGGSSTSFPVCMLVTRIHYLKTKVSARHKKLAVANEPWNLHIDIPSGGFRTGGPLRWETKKQLWIRDGTNWYSGRRIIDDNNTRECRHVENEFNFLFSHSVLVRSLFIIVWRKNYVIIVHANWPWRTVLVYLFRFYQSMNESVASSSSATMQKKAEVSKKSWLSGPGIKKKKSITNF